MQRSLFALIGVSLFFILGSAIAAPAPVVPVINAKGYLLMDFHSGQMLVEKNGDARMEPASLTKMLSAYVVDAELAKGNIRLDSEVTVSEKAWRMEGSRMFIDVGTKVSVEQLLKGMIIQSGNDATVALAEFIGGSEDAFVGLMNQHAAALGMKNSHFTNSTGLPHKEHYTTPRDLALLAKALIRDFPESYAWYAEKQFSYNNISQYNRNRLLWRNEFVDGIKTGHTESAGYCLVASMLRDDMRLIAVVLGTKSEEARAEETQKLLGFGFRFYETHRLYAANEALTTTRIWKGENEQLPLGLNDDLYLTIPRGQYKQLNASMQIDTRIIAPAKKGDGYGTVNVTLENQPVAQRKLVALADVAPGSLWIKLVDEVKLLLE